MLYRRMSGDIDKQDAAVRAALPLSLPATDACRQIVLIRLRSPTKAEFKQDSGGMMQIAKADSILVLGTVEAKYGSGAMARSRFRCAMRRDTSHGVWLGSANIASAPYARR